MTISKHISDEDLALYALGFMQPEEADLTAAHLKHCALCREEVARMQGDLLIYALGAEMQAPPVAARTRLLEAVAKERKITAPVSTATAPVPLPRNNDLLEEINRYQEPAPTGFGWFGWAGWAVAAGLALYTGWQFDQSQNLHRQIRTQTIALERSDHSAEIGSEVARAQEILDTLTDPTSMQVAMHLPAAGARQKPEGHAAYNADRGDLVFVASHLDAIRPSKTYELWLLPSDGGSPMPAGLFRPDANGNASVVLPPLPKGIPAKGFGVTVEAEGGATKPTLPIVLMGT